MNTSLFYRIVVTVAMIVGAVFLRWTLQHGALGVGAAIPGDAPGWLRVIHFTTNAVYLFRLDPGASALSEILGAATPNASLILSFLWSILGFALLLRHTTGDVMLGAAISTLAHGMLLALFGLDLALVQGISWLPWFALAAAIYLSSPSGALQSATAAGMALGVVMSANQLAVIMLPAGIWLGWLASGKRTVPPFIWMIALAGIVGSLIAVPNFPEFEYPPHAHVVPDDGLGGYLRPLVGPESFTPLVDRGAEKSLYALPSLLALLAALVFFFVFRRTNSRGASGAAAAAILAALAAMDTAIPEQWAHILPLAAAARTVPELFYFTLSPIFLALSLLFLSSAAAGASQRSAATGALLLAFATILLRAPAALREPGARSVMQRLEEEAARDPASAAKLARLVVSPSYAVLRRVDWDLVHAKNLIARTKRVPAATLHAQVIASASSAPEQLQLMLDRNRSTRWSPQRGRQEPGEWICLRFEKPETLAGLELSPGLFYSDFPRAIRLTAAGECAEPLPAGNAALREIGTFPDWEGAVYFTPRGFPYFADENDVKLRFAETRTLQCICAEQIGRSGSYDWLVAEVFALSAKDDHAHAHVPENPEE